MGLLGILLILSAAALITRITYERRKYRWLKQRGTRIAAIVTRVWKATITWRDGSESEWYEVTAKWTDSGMNQTYIFWNTSFADMREAHPVGSFIYILIDPNNPKQYYMEL